MRFLVITQARSGSTRLPNKVLKEINGKSLLQIHLDRIAKSKLVDGIYVATTINEEDKKIEELAQQLEVPCYRGSEDDVLDRFYQCAKIEKPEYVVRVTSDCPLLDPKLIDEILHGAISKGLDYYANIIEERYPDGQDIEVVKFSALEKAWKEAKLKSDREHVTPYIRNNSSYKGGSLFLSDNHGIKDNFSNVRLTVDESSDLKVIEKLIMHLGDDKDWRTYTDFYIKNQEIRKINEGIQRNEGYQKSIDEENNK